MTMAPTRRCILALMAVPADAPDRYTTMADLRTALCLAKGVDPADIDPASGHDLSEAAYRNVRKSWRTAEDRYWGMKIWLQRRPDVMARVEAEALPKAGRELVAHALANGWRALVQPHEDTAGAPYVTVDLAQASRSADDLGAWAFSLTWHSRDTGTLRLFSLLGRGGLRWWHDVPSVRRVREEITAHPGPGPKSAGGA